MGDDSLQLFRDNADGGSPGGHYSHAVRANGFVFVSGQLPIASDGSKDPALPFAQQARLVLANVEAALRAAGAQLSDLAKVTVYVTDVAHWPEFDAIYRERLGAHRPARAVVPVGPLHHGFAIEIEAIAVVRPRQV